MTRYPHLRQLASLAMFGALTTTAACGDSTAPGQKVDVSVTVDWIQGPNFNLDPENGNQVACDVQMRATATGSGKARWQAATFKWYAGKDRSAPFDTSIAPAAEIRRVWSDSLIVAGGQQQSSTWTLWANVPFSGAIDFHYGVAGGPDRTATVSFDCGPAVPAGAAPPAITTVNVGSPAPNLEPSGTLNIDYTATSAIGVWKTAVLVSGPCEVYQEFNERLEKSLTRSVSVLLPANCELGAPVDVTVYVTDAALDRRLRHVTTQYTLVDKTRPWLRGATAPRPTGPYFTGDTVDFVVATGDNQVVKSIVWEVRPSGARDSVVSPSPGTDVKVRIPVRADWSGPIELRYVARDAAGNVSDTLASAPGSVAIYPTVSRATTWMDADEGNNSIDGEVVDLARGVVYLLMSGPGQRWVAVLSLASMKVESKIPLAVNVSDIDLTAGGDSLLLALPELAALGVIDLKRTDRRLELLTLTVVDSFFQSKPKSVSGVRALSNGKAFLVISLDPGTRRLLELDLATRAERYRWDAGYGAAVGGISVEGSLLTRSYDGSAMAVRGVDCVQRYDAATDQFGPCVRISPLGTVSSTDASGQRFAIGPDIYDASWRHLERIETLPVGSGSASALSLDGRDLFFPYGAGVVRSSAVDGRIFDRQLPPIRASRVRVTSDGRRLIAVGVAVATGRAGVAVIDLR